MRFHDAGGPFLSVAEHLRKIAAYSSVAVYGKQSGATWRNAGARTYRNDEPLAILKCTEYCEQIRSDDSDDTQA